MSVWKLSPTDQAVIQEEIQRRGLWRTLLWIWSPRGWTYRTDRVKDLMQTAERRTDLLKRLLSRR